MRKFTALALMTAALMFTSISQAAYTVNQFPVCQATGDQERPDIDGDWIVWLDERYGSTNPHVYGYTLAGHNEISICIDSASKQNEVAVSGNTVVWRDERNNQRDIYAFDLVSQTPLNLPGMPHNDGVDQQDPDVSGDLVIYRHTVDGFYNIWVYDSDPNTTWSLSAASTQQYNPAIDGTLVVWQEIVGSVWQILVRDTRMIAATAVVNGSAFSQWYPAISGTVVVWREDIDDDPDTGINIYGYDLDDPETGRFDICTASGNQQYPAISGDIVAWQDDSDSNIWAIDLADMGSGCFVVSDSMGTNQRPAVSGKTIVWQRLLSGNSDIYGAELLEFSDITVTDPNGGERYLAASSMTIGWTTEGLVDEVLIEFTSNGGSNWTEVDTVEHVGNTGSYVWDPIADLESINCLIRVTNTADLTASDTSDAAFEIYKIPDSITVTDPNGGEQYLAGSAIDIRWTTVGDVNDVKIMFSSDSGGHWTDVNTVGNTDSYLWEPIVDVNSVQCSIYVRDAADSSTSDMSDSWFTIFQCDESLTADLTGDCFVGIADFAEMAVQWLECGNPYDPNCDSQ